MSPALLNMEALDLETGVMMFIEDVTDDLVEQTGEILINY